MWIFFCGALTPASLIYPVTSDEALYASLPKMQAGVVRAIFGMRFGDYLAMDTSSDRVCRLQSKSLQIRKFFITFRFLH
jgi:hypothetical protein